MGHAAVHLELLEPFPRSKQVARHLHRAARDLDLSRTSLGWLPRPLLGRAFPVVALGERPLALDARELRDPVVVLPQSIGEPTPIESGAVYAGAHGSRAWGLWITTTRPIPWRVGAPALAWCMGPCHALARDPDPPPDLSPADGSDPRDAGLQVAADALDMGLRADHRVRAATARMLDDSCPDVARGLRRPLLFGPGLVRLGDAHTAEADYLRAELCYDLAYRTAALCSNVSQGAEAAQRLGRTLRLRSSWSEAEDWYGRALRLADLGGRLDLAAMATEGLGNVALMRGSYPAARRRFGEALVLAESSGSLVSIARAHNSLMLVATNDRDWEVAVAHGVRSVQVQPHDDERAVTLIGLAEILIRTRHLLEANAVLRAALTLSEDAERRALAAATIAHVAGLAGDVAAF